MMLPYSFLPAFICLLKASSLSASEGNLMRALIDGHDENYGDQPVCLDDARCITKNKDVACFENKGRQPNEESLSALSKASSGNFDPDDTTSKIEYDTIKTDFEKTLSDPDESFYFSQDLCSKYKDSEDPDGIDFPSLAVELIFDEKKIKKLIKKGEKPNKENKKGSVGVRQLQKKKPSSYFNLSTISNAKIRVDWYVSNWVLNQNTFHLCWKKSGQFSFSLCNKNNKNIKHGSPGVTYVGTSGDLKHYYYIVSQDQGSALKCNTEYKFDLTIGSGWFFGAQKETTWECGTNSVNCFWDDSLTAFSGNYVIQPSVLQNSICVIHYGDFNGDGKTDLLRTCDNKNNVLWRGNNVNSGFSYYGHIYTGSLLQDSADTCRLHIADFNGDGRDDFFRSCNNPYFNTVQYGEPISAPNPFKSGGYVMQNSVLQDNNGFSAFKLHIGDFNGDGRADILRTHANPSYNHLWHANPGVGGFSSQGYQVQTLLLENANNDCRIHIGNFDNDADGTDDVLRTCDNPSLNRVIKGTVSGLIDAGQVLPGSILEKKNKTCQLHIADYDGDGASDLFRTCDDPFFNVLLLGTSSGFVSQGYQLQGSMLQNSSNKCRLHIGDYNGDGKADLFRSCNSRCYNALYISTAAGGFSSGEYTLTSSLLENSAGTCKLHVGDYNGDQHFDLLRTCNNPYYNMRLKSIM